MSPLQKHLRASVLYGGGWAQHLPYIAYQTNTSYNRGLKTSPYNMFYGCYPPSILKTAVAYPARSPEDDDERQLLAATFSAHFEEATLQAFTERAATHARQKHSVSFDPGDYVTLWIAHERSSKLEPYVGIRRVREKVSDSVYILENINCDSNGTDKNQAVTMVHIDRIKKVPRPPRFGKDELKTRTINEIKDGCGVVEEVLGRFFQGHHAYLNIKWRGITDAEANKFEINTQVEPRKLLKCKKAQEYLSKHGYKAPDLKYGSFQGGRLAKTARAPATSLPAADEANPEDDHHPSEAPRLQTSDFNPSTSTKTTRAARALSDAPRPKNPATRRVKFQLDNIDEPQLTDAIRSEPRMATRSRQLRGTRQANKLT